MTLDFEGERFETYDSIQFQEGDEIYVEIGKDAEGFAEIIDYEIQKPTDFTERNYLAVRVRDIYSTEPTMVVIDYPFNRYYHGRIQGSHC